MSKNNQQPSNLRNKATAWSDKTPMKRLQTCDPGTSDQSEGDRPADVVGSPEMKLPAHLDGVGAEGRSGGVGIVAPDGGGLHAIVAQNF